MISSPVRVSWSGTGTVQTDDVQFLDESLAESMLAALPFEPSLQRLADRFGQALAGQSRQFAGSRSVSASLRLIAIAAAF